jgi:NADH dehydrogenase [ubiquinone] 1 alpha subcomplex assembly factor 5
MSAAPPQIFDPRRRMALRRRAMARGVGRSFLMQHMADELAERLSFVSRDFEAALLIGPIADFAEHIVRNRALKITSASMIDEEALPYPPASFDLLLSAGTMDSVNDLPGALVQIRRCLKPDGLFLGTMFGAGSLSSLKSAMLKADADRATSHIHPQIDLRAASDLVTRAGFALPVCDLDSLSVRYGDWRTLVSDLREAGAGKALAGARHYAGGNMLAGLDTAWQAMADEGGRVTETFNFVQMSGWAPAASQPRPAKRGSGAVSLAAVLPPPKSGR